jgi:hypothetical protein
VWIPSQKLLTDMANALRAHALAGPVNGSLDGTFLGLYQAGTPVLNRANVLADITEANFTGYARQALVWDAPYTDQAVLEVLEAASLHWQPTDAVVPNVITGLFIASAAVAGQLLASVPLPSPGVGLPGPLAALTVIARFGLDFDGNWGDFILAH